MNVPETFQVDPEQWEAALKEIQFPHLWYSMTKDKNHYIGCYNTARGHSSNKRVDFKFMKEVKHGYYLSMSEIVAEVNAKIIKVPKTINLHSDGFDICFDYDSFFQQIYCDSWSIKMDGSDLSMGVGFKKNEILRGSAPIVSLFMTHMKQYRDIQNQLVGDVRTSLLRVVTVKSIYGNQTCVTCEQPQSPPLSRSNIQTIEI